jgi:hypothetical protein
MKPFRLSLAQEYEGRLGEGASIYVAYSVEGALRIEALIQGRGGTHNPHFGRQNCRRVAVRGER